MIPRYSRPEMTEIWSDDSRYRIWFEVEAHACDALAQLGVIPASAAKTIWEKGAFDIARIDALWSDCRQRFGANGPWLCGEYSLADAMYAPVALRFRSYGATLSAPAASYLDTVLKDAPLQQWLADAALESWTIGYSEVGLPDGQTPG